MAGLDRLQEAIVYSALSGGKRFRPLLTMLTAEALHHNSERTLSFALAIEMVHTYSLIHDDLPLMDNDDFRRGQPTNHKVFGEAMALLAGDGLLTEAFMLIAQEYGLNSKLAVELIKILGAAAGVQGMVGGQALDIFQTTAARSEKEVRHQHNLKTGALIRAAIEGGAAIAQADDRTAHHLRQFGQHLGLAFQIADDLHDHEPGKEEAASLIKVLGVEQTRIELNKISREALECLKLAGIEDSRLAQMVKYNLARSS